MAVRARATRSRGAGVGGFDACGAWTRLDNRISGTARALIKPPDWHIWIMTPELQGMLDQLDAIRRDAETVGSGLSDAQFNWQPGPGRWSIGQCLNHLNFGVTLVLPAFDRAIAEGRAAGKTARGPFRYGWFSRMIIASMEP